MKTWWKPSVADAVFLLTIFIVLTGSRGLLDDPGVGWHLRNIDAMLEQGWWLTLDPFSLPHADGPARWYTNQWIGEIPYWLGWHFAKLEGMAIVNALIIALLIRWMYLTLLQDHLTWPVAFTWAIFTAMGTACSWLARPNVFTILFVFLTARICVRLHEGSISRRTSCWVWLIFAIWANTHGGFVAGLIILVATTGIECGLTVFNFENRGKALFMVLLTAGAFFATLVNPYGIELYRWVFGLLGNKYFMNLHIEWKPPPFNTEGAFLYAWLMVAFPALMAFTSRKPNFVELGLAVLWFYLALGGFRYVALWVVITIPLLARSSVAIEWLNDFAKRIGINADPESLFHTPKERAGWLFSVLIALVCLGGAKAMEGTSVRLTNKNTPTESLDLLLDLTKEWQEKHDRRPILFHNYGWGGYITWHGWPRLLNSMDDRNEVQGQPRVEEHMNLMAALGSWRERIRDFDFVCISPDTALAEQLAEDKEHWIERHRAKEAVIFERIER